MKLKKILHIIILVLSLTFSLTISLPLKISAKPDSPVHNIDTGLDYATIQEAINALETENGHTIVVDSGIYYEHVVVNKALTLVGEETKNTIVDGNGTGTVIKITASNVSISRCTIQNSGSEPGTSYAGIKISGHMANITGNHVTKNKIGIFVTSQKSRITENNVTNNGQGIALYDSSEVTVEANNVTANTVGISLALSSNNIIVNNNATNSSTGGHGITLSSNSFNNTILSNDLTNNYHGIWLSSSSNNQIVENNVANNKLLGIELASSPNNTFYHNSFINNPTPIRTDNTSIGIWDDDFPSGGNYWSDYTGIDIFTGSYQNETGRDGIGDKPYFVDENNRDNYPLMGMFSDFSTTWEEQNYQINVVSNSTVSDFLVGIIISNDPVTNGTKAIGFNVTGEDGSIGFCRICILRSLLNDTYRVFITTGMQSTEIPHNLLPCSNSTHNYLYFIYEHSTKQIQIIPEFPSTLILPLFIIVTLIAVAVRKKILNSQRLSPTAPFID